MSQNIQQSALPVTTTSLNTGLVSSSQQQNTYLQRPQQQTTIQPLSSHSNSYLQHRTAATAYPYSQFNQQQQQQQQQQQHAFAFQQQQQLYAAAAAQQQMRFPTTPSPPTTTTPQQTTTTTTTNIENLEIPNGNTEARAAALTRLILEKCSWQDKTIHVARNILGGSTINGFLRATAAAQRIKKQRARHLAAAKKDDESSSTKNSSSSPQQQKLERSSSSADGGGGDDKDAAAEAIKLEMMNARTAKKIRSEIMGGIAFCTSVSTIVRSVMKEIDEDGLMAAQEEQEEMMMKNGKNRRGGGGAAGQRMRALSQVMSSPSSTTTTSGVASAELVGSQAGIVAAGGGLSNGIMPSLSRSPRVARDVSATPSLTTSGDDNNNTTTTTAATTNDNNNEAPLSPSSPPCQKPTRVETVEAGNPNGSTLRKHRLSNHQQQQTPDAAAMVDDNGRKLSRKEWCLRRFELTRFRSLMVGDYVAAKVESRDLYIVARVVQAYQTPEVGYSELAGMSEAKRTSLYSQKVMIQDVEDYDGNILKAKAVARHLILPLPRSYGEATEWCSRIRKGARVYAMYPSTTSLYCATVIDSTTYCRGDDDIIVVEFDGDEDDFGNLPQRHIPARFVTLMPRPQKKRDFNSPPRYTPDTSTSTSTTTANTSKTKTKKTSSNSSRHSSSATKKSSDNNTTNPNQTVSDDIPLNSLIDQMAYGDDGDLGVFEFELEDNEKQQQSQHPPLTLSETSVTMLQSNNNTTKKKRDVKSRKGTSSSTTTTPSPSDDNTKTSKSRRAARSSAKNKNNNSNNNNSSTSSSHHNNGFNGGGGGGGGSGGSTNNNNGGNGQSSSRSRGNKSDGGGNKSGTSKRRGGGGGDRDAGKKRK